MRAIMRRCMGVMVLAAVTLLSGCATMSDVVAARESGKEGLARTYAVPEDEAWEIAKTVFRWEGADAIEEHRNEKYMLTSSGMNLVSYGAVMGAWIEPVDKSNTRVTVVTKRRVQTNIFTTLTEETFQNRFAQAVAIVKKGQTLPRRPPD
jgi:hypothetical protein